MEDTLETQWIGFTAVLPELRWHSRLGCVEERTNRATWFTDPTGDIVDRLIEHRTGM